ncbi:MAG: NADP-dependent oxidoreductase [Sulfuricurvum sp.]|nr:NADP-dependent oxidoreductase [Sulfuricurvum sp.]
MKAFVINKYGKKVALTATQMPEPKVLDNDVLIEIYAAGVNLLDSKLRDGEFKLILPYKTPLILGHDVAGVVVKTGSRVKKFKVGDEVYARPSDHRIGTFAEFIAVDENDVALKPKTLTMEEAASIPLVGLTAWQAFIEKAKLKKGEKVFIQAGSGGVGTFAIQLAKSMGAFVATTTSTANIELVKSLGADLVIDYKKEHFETILKNYDVVLNSQNADELYASLGILRQGGRLVSLSGPPDPDFADDLKSSWFIKMVMTILSRTARKKANNLNVDYRFLFMRANGTQLGEIAALIDAGSIRPVVDKVFAFDATNDALTYVQRGHAKGKVVIKIK